MSKKKKQKSGVSINDVRIEMSRNITVNYDKAFATNFDTLAKVLAANAEAINTNAKAASEMMRLLGNENLLLDKSCAMYIAQKPDDDYKKSAVLDLDSSDNS